MSDIKTYKDPVLVVRKAKSVNVVEVSNEATLRAHSNRLKPADRWQFEYMERKEAEKLGPVNTEYVSPAQAAKVAAGLKDENEALRRELEALKNKGTGKTTAGDLIKQIETAETIDAVNELVTEEETRATALTAKEKRLKELDPLS